MGELMSGLKRSHMCCELNETNIGQTVTVMGWVQRRRNLGKQLIFIALRDRTGLLQIIVDANTSEDIFIKAEPIRSEYVLAVKGTVRARTEKDINPNMKTGKIEIEVTELRILSEAETPPFQIEDSIIVKDDLRLKYRYIDLRRPEMQKNILLRHNISHCIRNFLSDEGFLEIETPMLAKSTPEGARDYLVPSRVNQGNFYALPQSPQQFKQLLMVSGMDRYFQIVKCFRDEDLRADRQPEFTQIDMELSFVDENDVMNLNEHLLKVVFKEVLDVDVEIPFKRMTYKEVMERYGSDKPDIRFGMELVNLSDVVKDSEFKMFSEALASGGSVRCINAKGCGNYSRKQIDSLSEYVRTYRAKGLAWIAINNSREIKTQMSKFFTQEKLDEIIKTANGVAGDLILICADKNNIVFDALGNLRSEISRRENLTNPKDYKFLWVTEFPLLEWSEEENRYYAKHHPFTSPMDEDLELMDSNPIAVRAKAYDVVLNGYELGGGSIRIHRSDIQEKMFKLLGFSEEEAYDRFGFLINAFKYGTPPHGGLAFGLDRIAMLIAGVDNLRDVIAFPKVKDASCPLTNAPHIVDNKQLEELGLSIKKLVMY